MLDYWLEQILVDELICSFLPFQSTERQYSSSLTTNAITENPKIKLLVSERWPHNLDRLDAIITSVDRLELLWLSFLTDSISVSNCVASEATIAFILLSSSLDDIIFSSSRDCRLFSTSLADSAEMCASPTSTNSRVDVLFPSDMVDFWVDWEKSCFYVVFKWN